VAVICNVPAADGVIAPVTVNESVIVGALHVTVDPDAVHVRPFGGAPNCTVPIGS
jgi:hypothetical protein